MIPPFKSIDEEAKKFIDIYVAKNASQHQVKDMTAAFKCGYLAGTGNMFSTMDATNAEEGNENDVVEALDKIRDDVLEFANSFETILKEAKEKKTERENFFRHKDSSNN